MIAAKMTTMMTITSVISHRGLHAGMCASRFAPQELCPGGQAGKLVCMTKGLKKTMDPSLLQAQLAAARQYARDRKWEHCSPGVALSWDAMSKSLEMIGQMMKNAASVPVHWIPDSPQP